MFSVRCCLAMLSLEKKLTSSIIKSRQSCHQVDLQPSYDFQIQYVSDQLHDCTQVRQMHPLKTDHQAAKTWVRRGGRGTYEVNRLDPGGMHPEDVAFDGEHGGVPKQLCSSKASAIHHQVVLCQLLQAIDSFGLLSGH